MPLAESSPTNALIVPIIMETKREHGKSRTIMRRGTTEWVFGEFLDKIADAYAGTNRHITLVLDNTRYQKCQSVAGKAKEPGIEFLYLPALPI
ncbi:MAG: hypothetical protein PHD43_10895 [Methylococcales bacterium]|nr:hypothetical protein [Methylococcales bacterium]